MPLASGGQHGFKQGETPAAGEGRPVNRDRVAAEFYAGSLRSRWRVSWAADGCPTPFAAILLENRSLGREGQLVDRIHRPSIAHMFYFLNLD